jgi:hypothetical protein
MTKGRIISAIVLFAVLGAFGGVYQFYFKTQWEAYSQDEQLRQKLEATIKDLQETFGGVAPEQLVRAWRAEVQPWTDAMAERGKFFNFGNWYDHEAPPKEGPILKFWYDEQSNKMIYALYKTVSESMAGGGWGLFPPDIRQELDVASLDDWTGKDVTEQDVDSELGRLAFGISACKMLLDAKAYSINKVLIWEVRQDPTYGNLVRFRTLGLSFSMTMKDFVNFLEQLRTSDRYFSVDGLDIRYPYVAYNTEPRLEVDMLLSQARYAPPREGAPGGVPGVPGVPGMLPGGRPGVTPADMFRNSIPPRRASANQQTAAEPGFFGKAWKLFKRYVLYTN